MKKRTIVSILGQFILAMALLAMAGCHAVVVDGLEFHDRYAPAAPVTSMTAPELWIIASGAEPTEPFGRVRPHRSFFPTKGKLVYKDARNGRTDEPQRTDVKAQITGFLATTTITQTFTNKTAADIDAAYVFGLPDDSAVGDFTVTIGQRHIRGLVRPKEEAEHIYHQANDAHVAAMLLRQDASGTFCAQLGQLARGKTLDIQLTYAQTLQYRAGWWCYHCYSSGTTAVAAHIQAPEPIAAVQSDSPGVSFNQPTPQSAEVELPAADFSYDRELTIAYRLVSRGPHAMYVTQSDPAGGGYAALMITGDDLAHTPRMPLRLTVVLDRPGATQTPESYQQAKNLAKALLGGLDERDQFQILLAPDRSSAAPPTRKGDKDLLATAEKEIDGFQPGLMGALAITHLPQALDQTLPRDSAAMIPWLVVINSDFNPDYAADFRTIRRDLGNFHLAYVPHVNYESGTFLADYPGDLLAWSTEPANLADHLLASMASPTFTQVSVDWKSAQVEDVFPALNDVFPDRPLVLLAHCTTAPPPEIVIQGYANGKQVNLPVKAMATDVSGLDRLWARRKISDLSTRYLATGAQALLRQITQIALDHGMASPFTSILLVDAAPHAPAH